MRKKKGKENGGVKEEERIEKKSKKGMSEWKKGGR